MAGKVTQTRPAEGASLLVGLAVSVVARVVEEGPTAVMEEAGAEAMTVSVPVHLFPPAEVTLRPRRKRASFGATMTLATGAPATKALAAATIAVMRL